MGAEPHRGEPRRTEFPRGPILLAAARLDVDAYRSIAADPRFLAAALVVVGLSAISHAGLGVVWATEGGWAPIRSAVPAALSQFVIWLGLSVVAFGVGRGLGSRGSLGGVLRTVGVAQIPAAIYVLGVVPPLLLVMAVWWVTATYAAVRGALGLDAARTVVTVVAGLVSGYLMAGLVTVSVLEWLP